MLNCELCLLHKLNPISTGPIESYGNGKYMVVFDSPTKDDILMDKPSTIYNDMIKKIFGKIPYIYTHLVRCLGEYRANHVKTCMRQWLLPDIDRIDPEIIFPLGIEPTYRLTGFKGNLQEIVGRSITKNGRLYIPNYHPNYVLNQNKSIMETFVSVFRSNIHE